MIATTQCEYLEKLLADKGHRVSIPFEIEEAEYKHLLSLIYNDRDEELTKQLKRMNVWKK